MNPLIIARIDWEVVSGITGIVSAIVAVISLFVLFRGGENPPTGAGENTKRTILYYLLFCSAWVLLVIAFNWIFEPFGGSLTRWDEKKLYGIMISAPALMLANYALNRLGMQRERKLRKSD